MRVRLKGINQFTTRLADGRTVTYYYAWKGGPRLPGKPGDPEFIAAYQEAVSKRKAPSEGTLLSLLQAFQQSQDAFLRKSKRYRQDLIRHIKAIEKEFGDFPLAALADRRARGEFMAWRDRLAERSLRQADYAWTILARILSWALDRGLVSANPCAKGGRLYRANRADKVWTPEDEAAFVKSAPEHLHLALLLALWTGQRQGDLLRLTWPQYDGTCIRLQQSKTGQRVVIPVGTPLKAALDAKRQMTGPILVTSEGRPWTTHGFQSSWRKACAKAGIVGVTFNDLRGTAVTRLAVVGCTEPEIVAITGHDPKYVREILYTHYLHRDQRLGENAIRKLESGTKLPNELPNDAECSRGEI